ncbi:MAG: GIY-YIG nuclease family protein [Candidatus Omnitrophica bacterium]|nr:GIY-YIG nuclease family protein [Candidatus Omnitrophota bacterium]MDD5575083.1 GIY-YIG nuclease family protein [Candidatus Omnitrophota bacterium]
MRSVEFGSGCQTYCVYVLYFYKIRRFYIGYTADLDRRIKEHRNGKVYSTSRMGSFEVVFYEVFCCKDDALRRERYFKTTKGKKALKLILRGALKA